MPSFSQHNQHLVDLGHCLLLSVTKLQDKFASLQQVNLQVKFQNMLYRCDLAHATDVHERNTVPYARFALKKRHGFCAKVREKNMKRHRLGTL